MSTNQRRDADAKDKGNGGRDVPVVRARKTENEMPAGATPTAEKTEDKSPAGFG